MIEAAIILIMTAVDQLAKLWAAGPLNALHGGSIPVIQGVFHFTYVENRGAAFGLLQNAQWFFIPLTIVAVGGLTWYLVKKRKSKNWWIRVALALLIAGAAGNFIDRLLIGYVRDMLDFCLINFPVFNVADCCVTIGAFALVIGVLIDEKKQKAQASSEEAETKTQTESTTESGIAAESATESAAESATESAAENEAAAATGDKDKTEVEGVTETERRRDAEGDDA